jgi:hypothetical protein
MFQALFSTTSEFFQCFKDWSTVCGSDASPLEPKSIVCCDNKDESINIEEILTGCFFQYTLLGIIKRLEYYDIQLQTLQKMLIIVHESALEIIFRYTLTEMKRIRGDLRRYLEKLEEDPQNLDLIKRSGVSVIQAKKFLPLTEGVLILCAKWYKELHSTADPIALCNEHFEELREMGRLTTKAENECRRHIY